MADRSLSKQQFAVSGFHNLGDTAPKLDHWSWEELQARLTRHKGRADRDGGPLWSPCRYVAGASRKKENVVAVSCLVLDIDTQPAEGQDPELLLPSYFYEAWGDVAFLIHSTHNHRPYAPRWRAVFPLAREVVAEEWPALWLSMAGHFSRGLADPACKDASRLYFFPTCPPEDMDHFAMHRIGHLLDPDEWPPPQIAERHPYAPVLKAPAAPDVPKPVFAAGGVLTTARARQDADLRELSTELQQRAAREIVFGMHPTFGNGRHMATLWLAVQLRDNDWSQGEALGILLHEWLPHLPVADSKGHVDPITIAEVETICGDVFSKPAREPWRPPTKWETPAPPPEELAPPEKPHNPHAFRDVSPREEEPTATKPTQTKLVAPPTGPARLWAPRPQEPLAETPTSGEFDFSELYNYAWLQGADVQPPPWVVENLCPVGCTELFGHAKLGKTFVALGVAMPVALGGIALSHFQCQQGEVLYIAAEDAAWRMKDRGGHLLVDEQSWPAGFWVIHNWGERMNARGVQKLRAYLKARPDTRMVILDPWHAMRVHYSAAKPDIAGQDYDAFRGLNKIGEEFGCAVVVVHHSAKRKSEDGFNNSSGSHALQAGAGTILEFERQREENTARLKISGRDVREEKTWALERNQRTGHWDVVGDAQTVAANQTHLAIWEVLAMAGPMRPKVVAEATGMVINTVYSALQRMLKNGEAAMNDGQYSAKRRPGTKETLFETVP